MRETERGREGERERGRERKRERDREREREIGGVLNCRGETGDVMKCLHTCI